MVEQTNKYSIILRLVPLAPSIFFYQRPVQMWVGVGRLQWTFLADSPRSGCGHTLQNTNSQSQNGQIGLEMIPGGDGAVENPLAALKSARTCAAEKYMTRSYVDSMISDEDKKASWREGGLAGGHCGREHCGFHLGGRGLCSGYYQCCKVARIYTSLLVYTSI